MRPKRKYTPTDPDEIRLVEKCKELGVVVESLYDFVPLSYRENIKPTKAIVDMLLAEVDHVTAENMKAVIYSAVSVPEFHDAVMPVLVRTAMQDNDSPLKQPIFNDIEKIALESDSEAIGKLLLDNRVGSARSLLVPTYARIARKSGIPVLRKAVGDPVIRSQALKHLSILGDVSIEPELQDLAKHPDSFHRKIARDALKRIEKLKQKSDRRNRPSTH